MIGLLVVQLLLAQQPVVAVTYERVPDEATRILVYDWRAEGPTGPVPVSLTRSGDSVVLRRASSGQAVVLFQRDDERYVIDGPFGWPAADTVRTVETNWHRTLRGPIPAEVPPVTTVTWVRADLLPGPWPQCVRRDADAWECWGLQEANRGVVVLAGSERSWWAVATPGLPVTLRGATWGRLVLVSDPTTTVPDVRISFGRPVAPPSERLAGVRLDTAPVAGAQAVVLAPGAAWICGESVPAKAWVEVRTDRAGPAYLSLQDISEASAVVPLQVALRERRTLSGMVTSAGGQPANGALVTMFRLIDPPPPPGSRVKPRRVFAAEKTTDERGTFQVDEAGEADYEILAWHSQFGRASVTLGPAQSDIKIRLAASGMARGRVLAGGRPAAGVDVISVPDAATFKAVEDLTEAKGGDARTGPDGRFSVMVAATGGGELRVGGGQYAVRRIPLPRPAVASLDLGDIDLGAPIEITAILDRDPGCSLRAVGPVGRTGLQVVVATRTADGSFLLALPEPGLWQFGLACGGEMRAVSPASVQIGAPQAGKELRFVVR